MALIQSTAIPSGATDYEIEQSLKFNDNDSAYLSTTLGTATHNDRATFSCWTKRGNLSDNDKLITRYTDANNRFYIGFNPDNNLLVYSKLSSSTVIALYSTAKFRDTSSWYHILVAMDTGQGTAANRVKVYVNGSQITDFGTETYPSQNQDLVIQSATSTPLTIGSYDPTSTAQFYDGYMTEMNFVDGQQLIPADFGKTGTYGEWKPIEYSGTYGNNGFYLPFKQDYTVEGFSTVTWKGTGDTTVYVGGTGFQPDLVWMKTRTNTANHAIWDSVRGVHKGLSTSATTAEITDSYGLEEFRPDGFETRENVSAAGHSNSGNMVAWNWDMGGSNATNNDGSYTSTVRANTAYGQSIVSYDATKVTNATVGHGLNSAPEMIIAKGREEAYDWIVYHKDLNGGTNPHTKRLRLHSNAGESANDNWGNAQPTSDVFTLGADETINPTNSKGVIAYCFHSVTGYSKFGSYTGNGSATGTVVTTGFAPAFVMIKRTDAAKSWFMADNTRNPNNAVGKYNFANLSDAEYDYTRLNFTSTGFQLASTDNTINNSGSNYIYMAFADKREYAYWLDQSGNNNDWTSNNLTESDISVDSPTNNFCTWNPLTEGINGVLPISNGNLEVGDRTNGSSGDGNKQTIKGTLGVSSGKWYIEFCKTNSTNDSGFVGVASSSINHNSTTPWNGDPSNNLAAGQTAAGFRINDGKVFTKNGTNSGITTSTGVSINQGNIYGIAFDLDNDQASFYINGTQTGSTIAFTVASSDVIMPLISQNTTWQKAGFVMNAGQDSSFAGLKTAQGNQDGNDIGDFYYTPPTGFLALCTKNLPDVAVTPSEHFNTVLYSGTGSNQDITGVGFGSDFVWAKDRSAGHSHMLTDKVRGIYKTLNSDNYYSEGSLVTALRSFNADGFSVGSNANINNNGSNFVAWNWKANGSGSSNTNGSINTTATSANVDAGFSIITYTGTGTNGATVGHGLSKAPEMIIIRNRDANSNWPVYHYKNTSAPETDYLKLDETNATADNAGEWNDTAPTSSVFTLGTDADLNTDGDKHIAYCFHSVDGYSKVGSYTGNGSTDGTFLYTGFRPMFVMTKVTSDAHHWTIYNTDKATYNHDATTAIYANESSAEGTGAAGTRRIDFLSNGFKLRHNSYDGNANGEDYIFLAFAETPFKYSNAR